ncbi:MAG: hypothetical protein JRF40_02320 [Deltaproteobacteria bacterium]|nr:hypothetical protein [Deltaproteobacteria bacterium]MBW2218318.1 hypothetical protein [Deltaproteobacteria bacterium]
MNIFILLAIIITIVVIVRFSLFKNRRDEKLSAYACDECGEHDCICREIDGEKKDRK